MNSGQFDAVYHYYCAGASIIEEHVGTNATVIKQHVWGLTYIDELVETTVDGTAYYAVLDSKYCVLALLEADGDIKERYEYTPQGKRQVFISAGANDPTAQTPMTQAPRAGAAKAYALCDIGFQGLMHDEVTGNIYQRAREYSPRLARFHQRDPWGYPDGLNSYAPYHILRGGLDPYGLWEWFKENVSEPVSNGWNEATDTAARRWRGTRDKASELAGDVRHAVVEAKDATGEVLSDAGEWVADGLHTAQKTAAARWEGTCDLGNELAADANGLLRDVVGAGGDGISNLRNAEISIPAPGIGGSSAQAEFDTAVNGTKNIAIDIVANEVTADVVGVIDPTGVVDATTAARLQAEGDTLGASLTAAGVLPVAGDTGKLVKWTDRFKDILRRSDHCPEPRLGPIYVDPKGNAIVTPPGGSITGSPDGRFIQARDAAGNPTGVRIDGPHKPASHPDPRAQQPHAHVPGVANSDGTPWLPINK